MVTNNSFITPIVFISDRETLFYYLVYFRVLILRTKEVFKNRKVRLPLFLLDPSSSETKFKRPSPIFSSFNWTDYGIVSQNSLVDSIVRTESV